MNNKTLAIFALIPVWAFFMIGFMDIATDETFDIFMGLWSIVFMTWAGIRLYRS